MEILNSNKKNCLTIDCGSFNSIGPSKKNSEHLGKYPSVKIEKKV